MKAEKLKTKKEENPKEWYNEVVRLAEIIDDRYPVKGMPVYPPYGYKIFRNIMRILENELEKFGVEPSWFPVLIPKEVFAKESEHIKGFEEEVFWITKGGKNELEEPLALRPTSETEMYYMFAKWIQSYEDLPLKVYMTNTVYRYETKATKALIRGREILWNEAHTVHRTEEDAREHMFNAAKVVYDKIFWDILALPYFWVRRPEWDKFAGAEETYAADAIMPDGRVLQVGTIHLLGQKFAKAYDIKFLDSHPFYKKYGDENIYVNDLEGNEFTVKFSSKEERERFWKEVNEGKLTKEYEFEINGEKYKVKSLDEISEKLRKFDFKKYVWQTSYGISMRAMGGTLYVHGDDLGLVLPPTIAPIQIVIVPIYYKEKDKEKVLEKAREVYEKLKEKFRVYLDDREDKTPGWKFYYWDLKGIPLRIDIGPRDVENNQVVLVKRNTKEKIVAKEEELIEKVEETLNKIMSELKEKAKKELESRVVRVRDWVSLKEAIENGKVAKAPFCMKESCAEIIKNELSAEVRGYDINPESAENEKCVVCGEKAKYRVYIAKSY